MKSKYFFKLHGQDLDKEVEDFDSYQEKTKINNEKCPHKDVKIVGKELKCSCGASWSGNARQLQQFYDLLKNRT